MPGSFLAFESVSKSFGRQRALANVSFAIERGETVGFVGPNGAGKSTAMRILTGLLRPDSGTVRLDGIDQKLDPQRFRTHIGALIESPACYPSLTAWDHIAYLARLRGLRNVDPAEVLRSVGLDPTSRKVVRQFSLGMKQRLGIAMATFSRPSLLILDEPMNGLDPLGMADLREHLRDLPSRTNTGILISSHLLGEIEQVCDRVLLIREGRLLRQAEIADVASAHRTTVTLRSNDDARAEAILRDADVAEAIDRTSAGLVCRLRPERLGQVAPLLVGAGLELYELAPRASSLEDVYVATYGDQRDGSELR